MGSASARLRRGGRSPTELYAVAWGEWFSLENCSLHLSIYTAEANDGGPSNCYGLVRDNSPVERSTWNNLGVRAHFLVCVLRCHLWLKDTHLLAVRVSIHWMTHLGLFEPPAHPTFSIQFRSASAFRRVLALFALSVAVDACISVTLLICTFSAVTHPHSM